MRLALLLVLAVAGCSSRSASRADTPTPVPPTVPDEPAADVAPAADETTVAVPPEPDSPADVAEAPVDAEPPADPRCAPLHAEIVAALATLPSPCATDDDCTCYVGGIQGFTGCGGVSDLATAERIWNATEKYREMEREEGVFCPHGTSLACAGRLCRAACVDGSCGEAPVTL